MNKKRDIARTSPLPYHPNDTTPRKSYVFSYIRIVLKKDKGFHTHYPCIKRQMKTAISKVFYISS